MRGWWFGIFLLCRTWQEASAAEGIAVVRIEGPFSYWSDDDAHWVPLAQGSIMPNGILLQAFARGSLRLSLMSQDGERREVSLVADAPSLWRLTPELVRDLTITSMYRRDLSKDLGHQEGDEIQFKSAWKRVQLLYSSVRKDAETKVPAKSAPQGGRDTSQQQKREAPPATLLHPMDGSILVTDRLPMLVPIVWKKAKHLEVPLRIYVGPGEDQDRPPLIAATLDSYTIVPVEEEGSYQIAIASRDGESPQKICSFYVILAKSRSLPTSSLRKSPPKGRR